MNAHDAEGFLLWLCGKSGRSLEEEYGQQLYDEEERRREQEEIDEATAEHHCDGYMPCPDLEFEDHDDVSCRYECFNGEVVCPCETLSVLPQRDGDLVDVMEAK